MQSQEDVNAFSDIIKQATETVCQDARIRRSGMVKNVYVKLAMRYQKISAKNALPMAPATKPGQVALALSPTTSLTQHFLSVNPANPTPTIRMMTPVVSATLATENLTMTAYQFVI